MAVLKTIQEALNQIAGTLGLTGQEAANQLASLVAASGATRVVAVADGTTFTPTGDTADLNTQANTQSAGTLTMNAPTGTPTAGQKIMFRIKSTNIQTFSWNAIYRGSTDVALPTASSGSSLTDYIGFIYNATDSKWDCIAVAKGY